MTPRTYAILAFVRAHGFVAWITEGDVVAFVLPYVDADGSTGEETVTVRTWAEARAALGY